MAIYHQHYAIDVAVGMIRDAIDAHGITNNTVIIYTSDNGFFCAPTVMDQKFCLTRIHQGAADYIRSAPYKLG